MPALAKRCIYACINRICALQPAHHVPSRSVFSCSLVALVSPGCKLQVVHKQHLNGIAGTGAREHKGNAGGRRGSAAERQAAWRNAAAAGPRIREGDAEQRAAAAAWRARGSACLGGCCGRGRRPQGYAGRIRWREYLAAATAAARLERGAKEACAQQRQGWC